MKIVAKLVEMIDDEIDGAREYAALAHEERAEHPRLADKLIDLATAEIGHMKTLHAEVTKLIEEIKERDGEPPADMMAIYRYEHDKQVKRAAIVRQMINEYQND